MKLLINIFPIIVAIVIVTGCTTGKGVKVKNQDSFPPPPSAEKIPQVFTEFGTERVDNYFWIRDKNNQQVIDYLNAENSYTQTVMGHTKDLQEKIFNEIMGRIKDADETYPVLNNGYLYYSRTESGKQYRIYCRKQAHDEATEEIIFDVNEMAEGKRAFRFSGYSISKDNRLAAYAFNETGSFAESTIKIRDLATGEDLSGKIEKASSFAWANDNKTLFYTVVDNALRPYRVYKHTLGSSKADLLIYEESDARFNTYVYKGKTDRYIYIAGMSTSTSEVRYTSADTPSDKFKVFLPRVQGVEYFVSDHTERFYIRYKDSSKINGAIYSLPLKGYEDKSTWTPFVEHNPNIRIEDFDLFSNFIAVEIRENGLNKIDIYNLKESSKTSIEFPEPVYSAYMSSTPEYDSQTMRYSYTSLNRPTTLYQYNMSSGESVKLKEQEVPSGFNPDLYTVERIWATAEDGVEVPMAVVYKKGLKKNGKSPALLYSYGSYGSSSDVYFSPAVYSLIDRGFVYAIAQIRGGSDLGEQWYEDGKLLKKKNTFTDFIACAERLISLGYTSEKRLAAMGGSAGGLLMGAVVNMRPDLFNTIVAHVPFVDVINTMLDTSLPLTTQEYEEWGDPNIEEYYRYILSYSPYDNVEAKNYPNILATGGLNDSQVGFHEPAKWVAKLRELKTDNNIVLLYTNMDSGHGGATGRYDRIKETAFEYAFILDRTGITK